MVKRVLALCIVFILLSGCMKNNTSVGTKSEDSQAAGTGNDVIKVVEEYNKAIAARDWNKTGDYLDGQAAKAFAINKNRYKNSSNVLEQENIIETKGESFSIVRSRVDMEILMKNDKKSLTRKWMRYYLRNVNTWKIIKAEELEPQYPNSIKLNDNLQQNETVKEVVLNFIKFSVDHNINEASKYLTGNLLNTAEEYGIKSAPKAKLGKIDVNILGGSDNEMFVDASYSVDNKDLRMIFHVMKIKNTWLINNLIG